MKNKGFTLVELLAVIAILAILVIMALPAVLRMYRQSRINNFQNEVRTVYKAAQQQFVSDSINLESGQKILYTNATSCNPTGVDAVKQLDMTGNTDFKYYVLMNVDGKVLNVRATNGTYSYSLQAEDKNHDIKVENIEVETNNESTLDSDIESSLCLSEEDTYIPHIATVVGTQTCSKTDIGCELTIAGENFYVISSNSTNTVLLAKYDLKQNGTSYSQDTSGTNTNIVKVNFLDNNNKVYWDNYQYAWDGNNWTKTNSVGGLLSPYDNESNAAGTITGIVTSYSPIHPYVYDEKAINIYPIVNAYTKKIEITTGTTLIGRLMTYAEAISLRTSLVYDRNNYTFWLGSASNCYDVWYVMYNGGVYPNRSYNEGSAHNTYAIRPVIVVNTSDL